MYLRKTKTAFILILLTMFLSLSANAAEDEKTDGIAILWEMEIADGKGDVFRDAIKGFNRLYNKKPGAFKWRWYAVMTGPDTGKYIARSSDHNWADMDAVEDLWDEEMSDFWTLNVAPLIENAERYITQTDDEIVHWTEGKEYKFFTLQERYVKSWGDFNKNIKIIHETLQKANFDGDYALHYNISGGRPNAATLVFPATSWADMKGPSPSFEEAMKTQMSEDELEALLETYRKSYKIVSSTMIRYLPEFSETK